MTSQKFIIIIWALFVPIYMIFALPGDRVENNAESLRGAFTIVVIKSRDSALYNAALAGFKKALKDKDIKAAMHIYNMKGASKAVGRSILQIKTLKPDLILTLGTMATTLASENIKDLPIVFSAVLNPVDGGLVKSMKSSGNNLTGASMDIPVKTQFEWLKKVVPNAKKIGVLYNPDETKAVIDEASKIAGKMQLKLVAMPVHSEKDVPKSTQDLIREIDVLWAVADSTVYSQQSAHFILFHALKTKTPVMGFSRLFVKAGALLALSSNHEDVGRQSGELAVRVLTGKEPSAIPITVPEKVFLSLNLRVAKEIGIKIPSHITDRADEVFK